MHFLLDNLIATIMAGSIFLILVNINYRNQQAAFESVNFYAMRQQQIATVDMLKRDMQNVTRVETAIETNNEFTFFILPTDQSEERRVTYRRVPLAGGTHVRIERLVEVSPGNMQRQGSSMETITEWQIFGRNAANQPVNQADLVTQVYVRFAAEPPYREGGTVKQVRWDAAFRPPMIQPSTSL